jgi:hypothetical protein
MDQHRDTSKNEPDVPVDLVLRIDEFVNVMNAEQVVIGDFDDIDENAGQVQRHVHLALQAPINTRISTGAPFDEDAEWNTPRATNVVLHRRFQ